MAKKKVFDEEAKKAGGERKMAKVVVSTKTEKDNYAFKEKMVPADGVREYIKEKKA